MKNILNYAIEHFKTSDKNDMFRLINVFGFEKGTNNPIAVSPLSNWYNEEDFKEYIAELINQLKNLNFSKVIDMKPNIAHFRESL